MQHLLEKDTQKIIKALQSPVSKQDSPGMHIPNTNKVIEYLQHTPIEFSTHYDPSVLSSTLNIAGGAEPPPIRTPLSIIATRYSVENVGFRVGADSSPLCLASRAMTWLLSWRNPTPCDETAIKQNKLSLKTLGFACRAFATELSLPLLTLTAAVETAVYAPLAFLPTQRREHYSDLLKSSAFTVLWSIKNTFYTNCTKLCVNTNEFTFRQEFHTCIQQIFNRTAALLGRVQ